MDERSSEILGHIENQRERLGQNLQELEDKVRSTTDWRVQFDKHPMAMMGLAMGGGLLLSTMLSGGRRKTYGTSRRRTSSQLSSSAYATTGGALAGSAASSSSPSQGYQAAQYPTPTMYSPAQMQPRQQRGPSSIGEQRKRAVSALDQIGAALISYATGKAREFLQEALPGFDRHLEEAKRPGEESSQHHDHQQSHEMGGRGQHQASEHRSGSDLGQGAAWSQSPGSQHSGSGAGSQGSQQPNQGGPYSGGTGGQSGQGTQYGSQGTQHGSQGSQSGQQGDRQRSNLNPSPSPTFPV